MRVFTNHAIAEICKTGFIREEILWRELGSGFSLFQELVSVEILFGAEKQRRQRDALSHSFSLFLAEWEGDTN